MVVHWSLDPSSVVYLDQVADAQTSLADLYVFFLPSWTDLSKAFSRAVLQSRLLRLGQRLSLRHSVGCNVIFRLSLQELASRRSGFVVVLDPGCVCGSVLRFRSRGLDFLASLECERTVSRPIK